MEINIESALNNINIQEPDYDYEFKKNQQKHKVELDDLAHKFKKFVHPLNLARVLIAIGIIWLICDVVPVECLNKVAGYLSKFMSYIATFVFSSMITTFINKYKKDSIDN